MQELALSSAGLTLVKKGEGLRLEAYQDSGGIWTIGYGHTGADVHEGMKISEFQAEALLRVDLRVAVAFVNKVVTVPILQNQFDALVDFCFNIGRGNFERSSLLLKLNRGDVAGVASEFARWANAGGKRVEGLERRRAAEAAMFRGVALAAA